ncbi:MAG: VWA domain-containing protein [Thermoanaerobaculia bacterium]|nr:VWA domain-containing protein [Thermoanaerobaculia bacterium]
MRFVNATLLALALAAHVSAQQPDELYVESIEVAVVSIDVFATDSSGRPVLGLTSDDFEILESGSPRTITNFSEVREDVPAEPLPTQSPAPLAAIPEERSRKLIFFIDGETLHPFNRNRVFEQIRGFAGTMLRPGDQAMLAVWKGGLRVEVPFTSLVSEFERSLVRLSTQTTGRSPLVIRQRETEQRIRSELELAISPRSGVSIPDAYRASISHARMYAEQIRAETRAKVVAMNGLLATLAGVEGKKAMIFVGEEFPIRPGIEMFQFVNETFQSRVQQSREMLVMSPPESSAPAESALFDVVGRAANANGVTVYMLSASTGLDLTESPAESREIRSNDIQFMETVNRISGFQAVASKTGGLAFSQSGNVDGIFDRIERDFDTYYSLGYRLESPVTPGERRLVVRSRKPGVEIRTRSSYYAKTTREQVIDRVVATLYYDGGPGDMEIRVVPKAPRKKGRGQYLVPVDVEIPSASLTLLPVGDRLSGKFSVFVGVSDGNGGLSRIEQKSQSISVPAAEAAKLGGKHFTYSVDLMMARGENILAVAVVDDVTNMKAFSRKRIDVK